MASIFISYSSKDKAIVERIYEDLYKADVEVWLDEREIKVGDDIRRKIEQGIKSFDYFGIVLSKSSINSAWVQNELSAAYVKEMESKKITILPIKIEECDTPALISGKKYADLSTNYQSGLGDLLKVLSQVRIREMNFPKTTIHLARRGQSSEPPQPIAFTCYSSESGEWDLAVLIESIGDKEAKGIVTNSCFHALNETYGSILNLCGEKQFPVKFMFYLLYALIDITVKATLVMDIPQQKGQPKIAGSKVAMLYRIHNRVFSTRVGDCGGVAGWETPNKDFAMRRVDPAMSIAVNAPTGFDWQIGQSQSAPLGFLNNDNQALAEMAAKFEEKGLHFENLDVDIVESSLQSETDFIALSSFVFPKFTQAEGDRMAKISEFKNDKRKLANYLCDFCEPKSTDCVVALMSIK